MAIEGTVTKMVVNADGTIKKIGEEAISLHGKQVNDAPREMQEKITLWAWRGILIIGMVGVLVAALAAAWGALWASKVFWTGASLVAFALAFVLVRSWVFKHR
jgi:hypothetical protein